jgi:hypothetical protein
VLPAFGMDLLPDDGGDDYCGQIGGKDVVQIDRRQRDEIAGHKTQQSTGAHSSVAGIDPQTQWMRRKTGKTGIRALRLDGRTEDDLRKIPGRRQRKTQRKVAV